MQYDHKKIEKKWQERWEKSHAFATVEDPKKEKIYVLDMFPYPSGEGLHVGHPKGYIATDVYSRHMRMRGRSVLHPMGWDAFGLPAENYALKNKVHPRVAVEKNIENFKSQLAHIGFDYDWSREINTTDPAYYKWTQWIFLQLYKKGLAYQSHEPINWCPSCMTGLANEDLDAGGICERCGTKVEKRSLPQWVLKITAYADRMLTDLDGLNWPEHIKEAQRNWIGRSEGVEIEFAVSGSDEKIKVFTTRPDTLFGATYVVLAPEHPLLSKLSYENKDEIDAYIKLALLKQEMERTAEGKEKTGVEIKGVHAINPANKKEIPIYVADYVLGGYGTGAIMAVPAHDERDFAFAKKFNVPIAEVIEPETGPKLPDEQLRSSIVAIVEDPVTQKYLTLNWGPKLGGTLFVGGGREEGESAEDTARREIGEETGFTNLEFVSQSGKAHHHYFAFSKNVARNIEVVGLYFKLAGEEKKDTEHQADEKGNFVLEWLTKDEVFRKMEDENHLLMFKRLVLGEMYTGKGILTGSGQFDGLESEEAKKKITESVGGKMVSTYKIKDWVFSRQRYWGEPIPIIHCEKDGAVAVPESDLPVLLPEVEHYEPSGTGESPLATITEWVNTTCPTCGGSAKRETNTMPQWAGSSWYYLRFMDPHNDTALVGKTAEKYWAPVDVYVGGDHAVRHLIYARFWHKFLYDIGTVSTVEPFARLEFLGFILAEDGRKMSKRYGNVINPTDVVATYGADAFRIYEMFMGPFENTVAWSTASIAGTTRFVERVWKIGTSGGIVGNASASTGSTTSITSDSLEIVLHQTIKKVSEDIEAFKFNTAISQMMVLLNAIEKEKAISQADWKIFLQLLYPFAPHVASELWEMAGNEGLIEARMWPNYDESKLSATTVKIAVQINGKVRGSIEVAPDSTQEEVLTLAGANPQLAKWLPEGALQKGNSGVKVTYVPGRILSFAISTGA